MSCTKQARGSQRGVVLLSVLSLMLILSVLVSSAGRQMHWLLQATTQGTNQVREQADHRLLVAALFALDVGFCRRIQITSCVAGSRKMSAFDSILSFQRNLSGGLGAYAAAGRWLPVELAGGWLRKRGESPHAVAALWFSSPPL